MRSECGRSIAVHNAVYSWTTRSRPRAIGVFAVWAWLAVAWLPAAAEQHTSAATAEVRDASGRSLATAELREDQGKVMVSLVLPSPSSLTGRHALHIMEIGRCDPPDFASAGGIFNPFGKQHGLLNSGGPMAGDLPNLSMPLQRYNAPALGASLAAGPASLLGPRGASLVIYANEDDGVTGPDGSAGGRIACGVITATAQQAGPGQTQAGPTAGIGGPGLTLGPALIIVVLGAALIGAGLVLRRPRQTS